MVQTGSKQRVWSTRVQEQAGRQRRAWAYGVVRARGADRGGASLLAQAPLGAGARICPARNQLLRGIN
jgi:hypothetical protein